VALVRNEDVMDNRLWIAPLAALALWSNISSATAQYVPPPPPPGEAPSTTTPAPATSSIPAEQPAAPSTVPPPPPPATYTTTAPEQAAVPSSAPAPEPRDAGWFSKGKLGLSILLGSSFSGNSTYFILGADLGYYLIDGLEIGVGGTFYLFDDPFMLTLSPHVRYVLHMIPVVKPYVGAFYRHYIIASGFDDKNSVGARLGAYIAPGRARWYFGVGAVYEHLLDCNDSDFISCDDVYPELSFTIGF
jgi:hypothetical protein